MGSVQDYWARVRRVEADLPPIGAIFVTSEEIRHRKDWRGGVVVQVSREQAARIIVDGTHRLSTQEEIDAWHADQEARREQVQVEELRRQNRVVISLPALMRPATDAKKALSKGTGEPGRA